jgi:macrolide-specific efflux system membrane fusion protein
MRRPAILVATVLVAGAGAYFGRQLLTARVPQPAAQTLLKPELRSLTSTVTTTGVVRLRIGAEVRVGCQVSGIVKKLNVTVGSHIRQGAVIAEIDSTATQSRLNQARAQIAVAEQAVERADVELDRAQRLADRGIVPRQQAEDAALSAKAARAQLDKNRKDADVVATDLSYAVIRAPISGTVASVSTQEGETVAASFAAPTFVTIIADHALQLIAMVDETDIANVARADMVSFSVEAYPAREFRGRVDRIAPKATIVSGVVNYEVMVDLDQDADRLKPDMTANISIKTAERKALVVPNVAVQRDGDQHFVYVHVAGRTVKRVVTVGARDGNVVEIKAGLTADERVVVDPIGSSAKG